MRSINSASNSNA